MPILGVLASAITGNLVTSSYESIATITGNTSGTITFTSIPQTYKHLQLRSILRTVNSSYTNLNYNLRVGNGSIDTGSNYAFTRLYGTGSGSAYSDGDANQSAGLLTATSTGSPNYYFATTVLDILDYSNTNKYKTMRSLSGFDLNGSGGVYFQSFLWMNNSGIDTMQFNVGGGSPQTDGASHFALYGIKG
jgi:hypothetical protein